MRVRIPIIAAFASCAIPAFSEEIGPDLIREAGAKFQKNCIGCHQPPDLRFETDKAWVGQIRTTA